MTKDLAQAKTNILWAASEDEIRSSYIVILRAQIRDNSILLDTYRHAYWILVGEGKLERTFDPAGVKKCLRK